MRRRIPWGYAFLVYITVFMSGCGFLFVHGPPADHAQRMERFSCTESNVGPILDGIWGSLNAIALVRYATDESWRFENDLETAHAVIFGGWVIFSGSASIVGFNKTKSCKQARAAWGQRLRESRRDGEDGVQPEASPQGADSTQGVWGRVAEWTDPMFAMPPDSAVSDTTSGS